MKLSKQVQWAIGIIVVYFGTDALITRGLNDDNLISDVIKFVMAAILVVVIITVRHWAHVEPVKVLVTTKFHNKLCYYFVALVYVIMYFLFNGTIVGVVNALQEKPLQILNIFLLALAAGIFEESLSRGLLFDLFWQWKQDSRYRLLWAAVGSSVCFAVLHLMNFVEGQSLISTIQQMFMALIIGLLLAYLRIVFHGLKIPILVHFLLDFAPSITGVQPVNPWWPLGLAFIAVFVPICYLIWRLSKQISNNVSN